MRCGALMLGMLLACSSQERGDPDLMGAADAGTTEEPDATPAPVRFPMPDWPAGDPADVGLDVGKLDAAATYAESIGSRCLLVIRDGALVYERYWGDTTRTSVQQSWSVAKSFTSALVGIAITRGEIESVDQSAADFIPVWRGTTKEAITIRNLLSMNSGLDFSLVSDNMFAMFSSDMTADVIAMDHPDAPGDVWNYTNKGVQVLEAVLKGATGRDVEEYAEEHLWQPIGMNLDGERETRTHWARDDAGNTTTYMNMFASCRDLARLGYLYLQRGNWDGGQLIASDYVDQALTPSQNLNRVYGWLWWVNGEEPAIGSTETPFDGTMMPFAPDDLFSAQGLGQSFIDVIPSTHTMYIHVRPAPHDPMSKFFADPDGTMDALFRDGERIEHKELMRLLLQADD